jgi:crescentin
MAKLSDLFGRKGLAGPDKLSGRNGNGGDPISIENLSDVGSRMGEENEVLRNLLTDTGRKISELDDLKEAIDKLVAPVNSTLRALEQYKSQTLSLSGMLTEARTAYETLRTEFYQVDRKATALEAEGEKLREDLELSRETNRGLESARLELTDDLNALRAHSAELDRQLSHETTQRRALGEARRTLHDQFNAAEKRIVQLEGELAAAREKLTLLDDEKRSLQIAIDQALNETARLTRRLTESENTQTATRAQLGKVEASFAEAYAERGRLGAALDEAKEQHLAERNSLNMRLDALQSRAATAERLLSEARQNLIVRTEEVRAFDRKSVEATIARNNAEKRLAQIEARHEARERQIRDHEQARTALAERNNALTKTLKVRETGLARAEEKIAALTERNGHLEADIQVSRTNIEKRVEDLNSALQRERMERAVVEGALEAARKDNSRLQGEVAALRSTLRRGAPLDDAPALPAEAANDETPSKGKRVKGAEGPQAEAAGMG